MTHPDNGDVLVVEDHDDLRDTLGEFIRSSGYDVRTAVDGLDGLRAVDTKRPRLILVDFNMPRMDGRTFILRVKGRGHPAISTALLSGDDRARDIARELGVLFLPKPVDHEQLTTLLSLTLDLRRM